MEIPVKMKLHPKTDQEKKFIRSALSANLFLKALSLRQLDLLADYMEQTFFSDNQSIITEGGLGTHMYVLADGLLEVRKEQRILKVIKVRIKKEGIETRGRHNSKFSRFPVTTGYHIRISMLWP